MWTDSSLYPTRSSSFIGLDHSSPNMVTLALHIRRSGWEKLLFLPVVNDVNTISSSYPRLHNPFISGIQALSHEGEYSPAASEVRSSDSSMFRYFDFSGGCRTVKAV